MLKRIMWTARYAPAPFFAGFVIAALGLVGYVGHEPMPSSSPFESPIPFTGLALAAMVVGIALSVITHVKCNARALRK